MEDIDQEDFIETFAKLINEFGSKTKEEALKHAELIWKEMDEPIN